MQTFYNACNVIHSKFIAISEKLRMVTILKASFLLLLMKVSELLKKIITENSIAPTYLRK